MPIRRFSLLFLVLLSLALPGVARAQEEPQVFVDLENVDLGFLSPGKGTVIAAPLENVGGVSARVQVEPVSLGTGGEGWFSAQEVTLAPGGRTTLTIRLDIPADARPKSYAAGLRFLTPRAEGEASPGARVTVRSALQIIVTFIVEGVFLDLGATDVERGEPVPVTLAVGNYTQAALEGTTQVEIYNSDGRAVAQLPTEAVSLASLDSRSLHLQWDTARAEMGTYRAVATARLGEETATAEASFTVGVLQGQLGDFTVSSGSAGDPILWQVSVENTGNRSLPAAVTTRVQGTGGEQAFFAEKAATLEPGSSFTFRFELPTRKPGLLAITDLFGSKRYTVQADVTYGRDRDVLEKQVSLSTPLSAVVQSLGLLVLVLAILAVGSWWLLRLRRRWRPAA